MRTEMNEERSRTFDMQRPRNLYCEISASRNSHCLKSNPTDIDLLRINKSTVTSIDSALL